MTARPVPVPSRLTQPFWDAAARHELSVQRCRACATHLFYPRYLCTTCGSGDLEWVTVSGRGTVFTYTIARRPTHPGFDDLVPYVIAVVELDEGPKLTTNIVDADPGELAIGMRVVATFDDIGGVTLVDFRPA